MSAIRQSRPFPHKRLWVGLLWSVIVHAVLLLPPSTAHVMTLTIPAPELAVAFAMDRRTSTESKPEPLLLPRPAAIAEAVVTEPEQATASTSSASDAATNHLHSLLHESLNRHFIYPPMAHRNGWEGRVELLVQLDQDGRLHALRVVQSSGYPLLDEDALLTLRRIGSIPRARAWLPERGYATTLPVIYKLKEG